MKDFFKTEDFEVARIQTNDNLIDYICILANEKLNKLIESWPVVYGFYEEGKKAEAFGTRMGQHNASHTAKLAFIEEIKIEPCYHPFSHLVTFPNNPHKVQCGICNVELVATWNEKK